MDGVAHKLSNIIVELERLLWLHERDTAVESPPDGSARVGKFETTIKNIVIGMRGTPLIPL